MNSRSFPAWKSPCVSSISSVSSIGGPASSGVNDTHQNCEIICNMLAMLSCSEKQDAHKALLAMTNSPESCQSLRRAGCIPLLIQILHPVSTTPADTQLSPETKIRASKALKNIVRFNPDEQMKRKEMRILRLLEAIRSFSTSTTTAEPEKHPTSSATALMRLSFDEEHRNTMCTLGAIHALADLILSDHRIHGPRPTDADCTQIRRYSCMTLTNLTFGDGVNKALLCSMTEFLASLVAQLDVEGEDVVQVTASVLRNLSWHADSSSRTSLMETEAVSGLMKSALRATKESTMKATLSALWNLSAHSVVNKAAICSTPNALKFLLSLLRRNKAMTIVENAGGILRNISSHVAQVEDHRLVLRECHCYEILLEHLKSSSLTVVSNACGTLWNLSGHKEVQRRLIELNAVPMLKSLIYSKHERISQGASAALRNILSYYEQTSDPCQNYDADNDQPLDLTITSCKSSPVRKLHLPAFLNPPLYNGSVSSTRSCPDIQLKQQQQVPPSSAAATAAARNMDSATSDETFNYSHYDEEEEEEEKHQQKDTVKTYCDEGTPGFSGSMVDLSCQAADTCIQFQVEGTPAVFSRTSSLSSIEENQHGENPAEDLDSNKKLTTIVNSGPLTPAPVLQKRVMFSAEETPLMFSRCSSVASLESCGDLNTGRCESDCVSEFSRRTSEVVSPSELPESPRATDQTPLSPPEQSEESPENEFEESKRKQQSGNNDEVKVFAMEGTPFLISTATSLSDIIGELDNQAGSSNLTQAPPRTARKANILPQPVVEKGTCENNDDVDPDDPIYSDVTLLQRCINKGRAVGVAVLKKPSSSSVVEEEEVDLSYLIQKGRKQLFTRSEDNLKQYAPSDSGSCKTPPLPMSTVVVSRHSENSYASQKQFNGSLPSLNQNHQRIANINLNVVPPTVHETPKDTKTEMTSEVDCITNGTATLKISQQEHDEDLSPNANTIHCIPDESDCKSVNSSNNFKVSSAADDTDNDTLSQSEDTTWTDETPTFSSPIPSMSISKALKKVAAQVEETLSEIDQPTLESLGTTLDSAGYHTDSLQRRQVHNRQLLLLQTSSSQVSNLLNQKPPQEFFDLDSSMISVASIKSEIFEDGIPDSPQLSSSSSLALGQQSAQNVPECSMGTSPKNSPPNAPVTPPSKYDTYVIKRVESPKNRRKDNPERFLTRTIEKCDLKLKPPVPPKPSGSSPQSALSSSSSTTAQVRPTRASELRASRSRDHSPTSSTTSLNTSTSCTAVKIPPKPPVRSTPPLNTTLPRNAKLMEGNNTKLMDGNNHPGPNTNGVELPHHQQQPLLPGLPSSSSKDSKLNFGGRIGNLFRKSFNKDKDSSSSGKNKGKDGSSSGSKIWVKREKALVPPFNYKPPDQQTGSNASITPTIMPTSTIGSSTSTFTSHNPVQPAISTNILSTTAAAASTTPTANSPTGPPPQASNNNNYNNTNASSNNSATLTSSSGNSSNGAPPKSSSKITTV